MTNKNTKIFEFTIKQTLQQRLGWSKEQVDELYNDISSGGGGAGVTSWDGLDGVVISTDSAVIQGLQADIDNNSDGIGLLINQIVVIEQDIATNTSGIATNTGDISTLQNDVGTNTTNISTNTTDIGTNATNITKSIGVPVLQAIIADKLVSVIDTKEVIPLPDTAGADVSITANTISINTAGTYSFLFTFTVGQTNNADNEVYLSYDLNATPVDAVKSFTTDTQMSVTSQIKIEPKAFTDTDTIQLFIASTTGTAVGLQSQTSGVAGIADVDAGKILVLKHD